MRRTTLLASAAVLASVLLAPGPADLEAQARRGPPAARQEMERRVQQRFQARVADELGLDQTQRRRLAEVAGSFQQERRALVRRELQLRQRLRGTGALLSDDAARAVLAEILGVQRDEARLLEREQERLLEFLAAPQVVRFYTLRGELADQIRRLQGQERPVPPGVW